jgi:hypothetical protein
MTRRNANGSPSETMIKNAGAIPYASQINNDSDYEGTTVKDALDALEATVGVRLRAQAADLDLQTLNDEVSVALGGAATDKFVPTLLIVDITAITGAANGDAEITVGTATGGTQILTATALTGLNALNERISIDLTGATKAAIAGDATIYVKCTTADTGAGTVLTATATIIGERV